jgi:hypothetical protein
MRLLISSILSILMFIIITWSLYSVLIFKHRNNLILDWSQWKVRYGMIGVLLWYIFLFYTFIYCNFLYDDPLSNRSVGEIVLIYVIVMFINISSYTTNRNKNSYDNILKEKTSELDKEA